jgi:hypothetical protein
MKTKQKAARAPRDRLPGPPGRGISNGVFPTGYFQRGIPNGVFPTGYFRYYSGTISHFGVFLCPPRKYPGYLTPGIPNGVFNPGYFLSFSRSAASTNASTKHQAERRKSKSVAAQRQAAWLGLAASGFWLLASTSPAAAKISKFLSLRRKRHSNGKQAMPLWYAQCKAKHCVAVAADFSTVCARLDAAHPCTPVLQVALEVQIIIDMH